MGEEPLAYASVTATREVVAAVATRAYEHGRVLDREGLALFGLGTAASFPLPDGLIDPERVSAAVRWLAGIERVDPGTGEAGSSLPVGWIAALAFDRSAAGRLTVPQITVTVRGEIAELTVVAAPGDVAAILANLLDGHAAVAEGSSTPPPDAFHLASARPHEDFLERVGAAIAEVRSGALDKVVLAREVVVTANRPLRQGDLLARLRKLHPSCLAFAVDGFLGASPELLIRRDGRAITCHPLAGTAPRSGDPAADRRAEAAMLDSAKERAEHRAVVDTIAGALRPVVASLEVPDAPSILELRNVSHLATLIGGELAETDGQRPSVLELVARLHPTPAVAGSPVPAAIEYLGKLEELDRDRYAGPLGWMDAAGDGEWHLGLRCALVKGATARLFAGVGILADSDPDAELAETQLKLQAFLAAAVRP